MELLIIGAGAVGSTYGYLASRKVPGAGAKVTYLIKPKHRADLEKGVQLYHWKSRKAGCILFQKVHCGSFLQAGLRRKRDMTWCRMPWR